VVGQQEVVIRLLQYLLKEIMEEPLITLQQKQVVAVEEPAQ
tara:strand:- start:301 stop:423 length:123 start_codon:yes stop_codon:yes gene_type:complete